MRARSSLVYRLAKGPSLYVRDIDQKIIRYRRLKNQVTTTRRRKLQIGWRGNLNTKSKDRIQGKVDSLFARADEAIYRAYALRADNRRLRRVTEKLLDQNHEITQGLEALNRTVAAPRGVSVRNG
jgi:hypothetical protein